MGLKSDVFNGSLTKQHKGNKHIIVQKQPIGCALTDERMDNSRNNVV